MQDKKGLTNSHSYDMMAVIRETEQYFMARHLKVTERGFARKNKHELTALLKKLNAESDSAVEILVYLMNKKDQDDKIVLQAASKLLDLQREVAQDINNDEMQRLISNVKFGGPKQLEVDDDDTPQIDFSGEDLKVIEVE
jgi:hypothetical protein